MSKLTVIFVYLSVAFLETPAQNYLPNVYSVSGNVPHTGRIGVRSPSHYQKTRMQWIPSDQIENIENIENIDQAVKEAHAITYFSKTRPYKTRVKSSRYSKIPYSSAPDPWFIPIPVPVSDEYFPPSEPAQFESDPTKTLITAEVIENPDAFQRVEIVNQIPENMGEIQGDPLENAYNPISEVTYVVPMDQERSAFPPTAVEGQFDNGEVVPPQSGLPQETIPASRPRDYSAIGELKLEENHPPQYHGYYEPLQPSSSEDRSNMRSAVKSLQSLSSTVLQKITQDPPVLQTSKPSKVSSIPIAAVAPKTEQHQVSSIPIAAVAPKTEQHPQSAVLVEKTPKMFQHPESSPETAHAAPKFSPASPHSPQPAVVATPEVRTASSPEEAGKKESLGSTQSESSPSVVPMKSAEPVHEKEESASTKLEEQNPQAKSAIEDQEGSRKIPADVTVSEVKSKSADQPKSSPDSRDEVVPVPREKVPVSPVGSPLKTTYQLVRMDSTPQFSQAVVRPGNVSTGQPTEYRYKLANGQIQSIKSSSDGPAPFKIPGTNFTYIRSGSPYPPPTNYPSKISSNITSSARTPYTLDSESLNRWPLPSPKFMPKSSSNFTNSLRTPYAPVSNTESRFSTPTPNFMPKMSSNISVSARTPDLDTLSSWPKPSPKFMLKGTSNYVNSARIPLSSVPVPKPQSPLHLPIICRNPVQISEPMIERLLLRHLFQASTLPHQFRPVPSHACFRPVSSRTS
ncbi:unnamed protein product [Bemisia tabaci]|uniref:Uncharacterized protein n=1 Tax=Bemisia tabaci TaxID=7038 RepID=A0A9P0AHN8_BEMTA|nr:unnamed protein product [Bemisia tabaci]